MEQIRIVKEMREHDRANGRTDFLIRPRFLVWENVPGAFSSNRGKDFQTVLTEIVRIVKPDAPDVPLPDSGKWSKSGCLMGYGEDGCPFSIGWRLHDAQFWGVPQRRKRIALVADFGGLSAPEILFERKGLSWNPEPCGTEREGTAEGTERSVDTSGELVVEPRTQDGCARVYRGGITPTLNTASGGQRQPCVMQNSLNNDRVKCLTPWDCQSKRQYSIDGAYCTLNAGQAIGGQAHGILAKQSTVYCLQGNGIDRADTAGCNGRGWNDDGVSYTLNTIDRPAVMCLNDQGGGGDECNKRYNSNDKEPDGQSSTVGALQA